MVVAEAIKAITPLAGLQWTAFGYVETDESGGDPGDGVFYGTGRA